MIFDNVKVGDKFIRSSDGVLMIVTELIESGFAYTCTPHNPLPIRWGFVPVTSGKLFYKSHPYVEWNKMYVKVLE